MFNRGAGPRLLLIAVHFTFEALKEAVPFVQVGPKLLNLVIARPCFVHLLAAFVQSSHFQPQFMIDGTVSQKMSCKVNEHLYVAGFPYAF